MVRHPRTGETVWFNHATFFNALTLPESIRDSLRAEFADDELPQNTFYGDGSPIPEDHIRHLQQIYRDVMVEFPWQKGDVVILDNILTIHARNGYTGPRKILTAMAIPLKSRSGIGPRSSSMTASNAEIFQTSAQQAHLLQASGGQVLAARLWLSLDAEPSRGAAAGPGAAVRASRNPAHPLRAGAGPETPGAGNPRSGEPARASRSLGRAGPPAVAEDLGQAPLAASLAGRNLLLGVALASADPAALRLLGDELQALLRGEALAEFDALQYADYAAWQGDLAQESIGQQGRAFWRGLLAEQARPLALPFERRVALAEAPCVEQLATPVADALAKLAEAGRISTDEALAVLWAAFLVELGQPASVVLGLEVSGRNEQLEQTVGHFARQLPLVLALDSSRGLASNCRACSGSCARACPGSTAWTKPTWAKPCCRPSPVAIAPRPRSWSRTGRWGRSCCCAPNSAGRAWPCAWSARHGYSMPPSCRRGWRSSSSLPCRWPPTSTRAS
jgi:hypothetical protein